VKTKNTIGFVMGIAGAGLQVPGLLIVFTSPGGWNLA